MKLLYLLLSAFIISHFTHAQDDLELKFDTKYYDAVDSWVLFPKKANDSIYPMGFIYIDQMAGISLRYHSAVKNNDGILESEGTDDKGMIIHRLGANTSNVKILSELQLEQLHLAKEPDWLSTYKTGQETVSYMKDIGYHLNHAGGSLSAIPILEKAYKIEPDYDSLAFELAFAYNATEQFDKALAVLQNALKNNENDIYLIKELGYAYLNLDQNADAEQLYLKAFDSVEEGPFKNEFAINLTQLYFNQKNIKQYKIWSSKTRKLISDDKQMIRYLDYWDQEIEK